MLGSDASEDREAAIQTSFEIASIDELVRSVARPLTVVALRLEQVRLRLSHGEDPAREIAAARDELEKAFAAFEEGRAKLLAPGRTALFEAIRATGAAETVGKS